MLHNLRIGIRGGSWGDSPQVIVRATFDSAYPSVTRYECFGFRAFLPARQPRA